MLALPVFLQYKLAVVHLVLSWLFIDCIYRVIAIMAVSLDLSSPERWPPCFGNAADLYSVRNFWGRVWHQMFRKVSDSLLIQSTLSQSFQNFQAAGCAAAHIIGAEKGSMLARYTKLYVGFAVSGLQHYMAARFVPSKAHGGALFWQMPCYAAVVTLEDALASAARSAGIQAGGKYSKSSSLSGKCLTIVSICSRPRIFMDSFLGPFYLQIWSRLLQRRRFFRRFLPGVIVSLIPYLYLVSLILADLTESTVSKWGWQIDEFISRVGFCIGPMSW